MAAERTAREIRAQAELMVQEQEREKRRRERKEEAAIRHHMTSIRRHMNIQQERQR